MDNNDEIIDEAEHKADQMREVCETNEDKEDAACMNDEGLFCSEHWTEFLNYLIDEGRQDERAECVAELEKLRSKTHQDEELIGIDQAIAALKHEAKTKEEKLRFRTTPHAKRGIIMDFEEYYNKEIKGLNIGQKAACKKAWEASNRSVPKDWIPKDEWVLTEIGKAKAETAASIFEELDEMILYVHYLDGSMQFLLDEDIHEAYQALKRKFLNPST